MVDYVALKAELARPAYSGLDDAAAAEFIAQWSAAGIMTITGNAS